jgi:hypothetical protein
LNLKTNLLANVNAMNESLSNCRRGECLHGESRRHPEKDVNIVSTYIAKRTHFILRDGRSDGAKSSLTPSGRLRLPAVTGGKFPLMAGVVLPNHRSARTTSSMASFHSLSAPAALPHQARHIITSRNPFLPGFRKDSQERSAGTDGSSGQSFDHHARHFVFRSGKSFTGISLNGREALIHWPTSVGRTSVDVGKLLPAWCLTRH